MPKQDYTPNTAIEIYEAPEVSLKVLIDRDVREAWLTRRQIAYLLQLTTRTVGEHLDNYKFENPDAKANVRDFRIVTEDGKNRNVEHYSTDVILYIGYRAHSTAHIWGFRKWVSGIIDKYLTGSLRHVEAKTYEGVRNLITQASDYDPSSDICRQHFAMVQNKLLYAVSGFTAAGLIVTRADHLKQNMGLNSWSGHKILLNDATVGKNYLTNGELDDLQKLAELIYALMNVFQRGGITMADWIKSLDQQIIVARRGLLEKYVGYSRVEADEVARREYAAYTKQLKSEYQQLQLL